MFLEISVEFLVFIRYNKQAAVPLASRDSEVIEKDKKIKIALNHTVPRQLPHAGGDAVHDIPRPWSNNRGITKRSQMYPFLSKQPVY